MVYTKLFKPCTRQSLLGGTHVIMEAAGETNPLPSTNTIHAYKLTRTANESSGAAVPAFPGTLVCVKLFGLE
jgi:hypothetical protein